MPTIHRSDAWFRTVWETSADAMALSDREGLVLAANRAYYRLYGLTPAEVLGKKFYVIFPEPLHPQVMQQYEQIFQSAEGHTVIESVVQHADGTERVVETYIDFIVENGQRLAMLSCIRDVTARKQTESELRQAKDELEQRVRERTVGLEQLSSHLRKLSAYLQTAREEERKRLSRELHDQLGGALTGLKLDIAQLRTTMTEEERHAQLNQLSAAIDETIRLTRQLATELRPSLLDDLGLAAALEWQVEEFEKRTGIRSRFHAEALERELDNAAALAVYRLVQEALTNVVRHAQASEVEVRLTQSGGALVLQVQDNGRGIPPDALTYPKSLGLMGMQERVHMFAGELDIRGAPGEGTTVRVTIPFPAPSE